MQTRPKLINRALATNKSIGPRWEDFCLNKTRKVKQKSAGKTCRTAKWVEFKDDWLTRCPATTSTTTVKAPHRESPRRAPCSGSRYRERFMTVTRCGCLTLILPKIFRALTPKEMLISTWHLSCLDTWKQYWGPQITIRTLSVTSRIMTMPGCQFKS